MTDHVSNAPAAPRRGGGFFVRSLRAARRDTPRGRWRAVAGIGAVAAVFALLAAPSAQAADPEPVTPLLANADPAKGAKLATRCKACHTFDKGGKNRFGPALWDIVGREKAAAGGFRYTPAFKKLDGEWDYESLNALIADPNAVAPGTRMRFPGIKSAAQRADLIRYLREQSDAPKPLPASVAAAPSKKERTETAATQEIDFQGLPPGEGREEVFYLCNACHSLKTVKQQGLPRDRWDELLDWMTEKQGMPALAGDERDLVLDYLAANYGIPEQQPMMMTPMSRPPLMPLPPAPK
jgi:cytochrome c